VEIVPGVHVIDLGAVQAYLFRERDRLTLIDTGLVDSASKIVEVIEGTGAKVEQLQQVVLTHYHLDHMGSAGELAERSGARVLAHALDAPVVRGEQPEEEPRLMEIERPFYDEVMKVVTPAPRARVDRELADGDEIDFDGGAQIVHVPGHTAGSIAIYVPARRTLFVGDAAARLPDGQLIVGVFNADPEQARSSFRRLAELDFEAAFFGHGAPMDRDASLAFRKLAERLG
jgi:glyoxylase-like metal-dependent hydrolase (beta-lactamase superfamily II)